MALRKPERAGGDTPRAETNRGRSEDPEYLVVGEVLRPHGVRGEMRMRIVTAYPERLSGQKWLYFGPERERLGVMGVRRHREAMLLRVRGVDEREAAEAYRGMVVCVAIADAVPLEDGEHYLFQVLGLEVVTDEGRSLGTLEDVIETGANDVYVVRGSQGEVLLPAIPDVVREVDVPGGRMVVHLLDGLLAE